MILKDYYKILNLDGPKVSAEKIKIAYREQAKKYHPDKNNAQGQRNTEERFKDINEAYRVLSNEQTKRKYDRVWNSKIKRKSINYQTKREKEPFKKELFNLFFGNTDELKKEEVLKIRGASKKVTKGENIETSIPISIEDGYYGKGKTISLKDDKGKFKAISFKVPEGIKNGGIIRLNGLGKKSKNGGENGDLLIKVNIQNDEKFELQENNLYTNVQITPWEAILGTRVEVEGIDEKLSISLPKGVQYGEKIEIKGKGYKKEKGTRGNLIITTEIMIPTKLEEEEKKTIEKLQNISKFNPRNKLT